MNISKTTWLLLLLVVFLIAAVSLGTARFRQLDELSKVENELATATERVNQLETRELATQKGALEGKLVLINSQLSAVKQTLSPQVDGLSVSDTLLTIARTYGVEITEISSSGRASTDRQKIILMALPFTVIVQGDANSILAFVVEIGKKFPTSNVSLAQMEISGLDNTKGVINFNIYTYQGGK